MISMSFHPTNHDLLFILTTLGIHCVDLGQIGVNGYLNTIQTPLLKFTSATCFTFQPTSTPNQQSIQDFIYLGTNDGSIAKLEVTIPVNASNLNQPIIPARNQPSHIGIIVISFDIKRANWLLSTGENIFL
jgi:hypothetical protein